MRAGAGISGVSVGMLIHHGGDGNEVGDPRGYPPSNPTAPRPLACAAPGKR